MSTIDCILLIKRAMELHVGAAGGLFLTVAIFLFAFSTIIANYFYGETNIRFITKKRWAIQLFRLITGGTVMLGALITLQTAWCFVDLSAFLPRLLPYCAIIYSKREMAKSPSLNVRCCRRMWLI